MYKSEASWLLLWQTAKIDLKLKQLAVEKASQLGTTTFESRGHNVAELGGAPLGCVSIPKL